MVLKQLSYDNVKNVDKIIKKQIAFYDFLSFSFYFCNMTECNYSQLHIYSDIKNCRQYLFSFSLCLYGLILKDTISDFRKTLIKRLKANILKFQILAFFMRNF